MTMYEAPFDQVCKRYECMEDFYRKRYTVKKRKQKLANYKLANLHKTLNNKTFPFLNMLPKFLNM